jgi:hypothetical protein
MSRLFPDTRPEAEEVLITLLSEASAARKVEMLGQLNEMALDLARAGLRARHPTAGDAELRRRLADLLLGPELAARVYGPLATATAAAPAASENPDE